MKDHDTGEKREFTPENIHTLTDYLSRFDILIGHNCIDFDFPVLRKLFGWEYKGRKIDTLIMSRTQRPTRIKPKGCTGGPHSVEAWGIRLGLGKVVHEDWDRFSLDMLHRCSQDVDIQVKIYHALLEEGKGEGWENAHLLNAKLFHYLNLQEEYGWYIDKPHLDNCLTTLNRWIEKIDRAIAPHLPHLCINKETKDGEGYKWVKKPFNKDGTPSRSTTAVFEDPSNVAGPFSRVDFRPVDLDKNVEVKQFLLDQGWEPDEWNTNNAGERTSPKLSKDDKFRGIQGSLGKLIARRVQCKQRRGICEGLRELVRSDSRIGARVSGMASTGRIRHSGIVNIPSPDSGAFFARWMRAIFSSAPGKILVGCDSKGNQIRQLAARMGEKEFTNAVLYGTKEEGTDLHSVNQRKAGVATRTLAKNFFYGFLFGAGDTKIGKITGGGAQEGRKLKEDYFRSLPGLKRLIDEETSRWRATAQKTINRWGRMEHRNGYIKGLDGRPILVESEHTILVYLLQSDEAIQMAAAYVIFNKWMEKRGWKYGEDYGCVIWYHDEYQVECKEELAQEVAALMEESIAWSGRFYNIQCPHEGESKIGKNWAETH